MSRPPIQRLTALLGILALSFAAIVVRLSVLQVRQAGDLRSRALAQRVQRIVLPATRGAIVDRNRQPLALSVPARDVYADPSAVEDAWSTATQAASVLGADPHDLLAALRSDGTFVYLARQVELARARRLEAMHLPGIGFLPASARVYPAGTVAAQVLGFVGVDGVGLSGLEYQYQDLLAGRPGERVEEMDPSRRQPIAGGLDVETPPVPGSTLVTTIDRAFQYRVETLLAQAVADNHAKGGTVIVMSPTGEIYAMASAPSFDPRDFTSAPSSTYRARAVTDAFEPGSTNKVITAAAAIQESALPLDARLSVPWTLRVGDFTIHDAEVHPLERLTLGDIIARSSNIGAVEVARRVGAPTLATYLSRFGLGRPTGVGYPGEAAGIMLPLYRWTDTSLATMAYGQGIAVTPLQMISVYATIANAGLRAQPHLLRGTIDPDGAFHPAPPGAVQRVVSASTARTVTSMLAYAVQAGTGMNARIPGYQVAGKTGTARIPLPGRPGYFKDRYIASFIGFLPASRPQVVIATILDRPRTVYGGVAAAPLFREVARYAIGRLGIEPGAPLPLPPHALPVP